jgi:long-chain acyl-CoA synthetase
MGTRDYVANLAELPVGPLPQILFEAVDRFGDKTAVQRIVGEGLEDFSYRKVLQSAKVVAGGLEAMGIERGDRVAILSYNRPEWALADWGCLCCGVQDVAIYFTLTAPQVSYILDDSDCRLVFAQDEEQALKARKACREMGKEIPIVIFEPPEDLPSGMIAWEDFLARGEEASRDQTDEEFRADALAIEPDEVATLIYTSGTTAKPKGVMLTHNNLFTNVRTVERVVPFGPEDSTLSFLPLCHVFQRTVDYVMTDRGCTIAYARSMTTVPEDLLLVRPTKVVSVPRLYEKTYQKVREKTGAAGKIVSWALEVGEAYVEEKLAGREPPLGGRIIFFVSGGGPLAPEINKFFHSVGIPILEAYGLTETSPAVSGNGPDDFKIGTVGRPVPGTEVKILEDGEILVRGPQVMKGYNNLPDETASVITNDGWFHTGDIGEIDEDGFLKITDRKKNILVTAGGKNIAPAPIEQRVMGIPFVEQVVMIGDGMRYPALLVVPAFERLENWARNEGLDFEDRDSLTRLPRVHDLLERLVFGELTELARFEMPKKIGLIFEEFTIENGILTPSQKVKRRVVRERYGQLIARLYDEGAREQTVFVE